MALVAPLVVPYVAQMQTHPKPSRRGMITGALLTAASANAARASEMPFRDEDFAAVLHRYHGFGVKRSGGDGDLSCGAWLEGELKEAGYACTRQTFETPFFEVEQASLEVDGATPVNVLPQAITVPTGASGMIAPLRRMGSDVDVEGAIALIELPHKRWSSALDPAVRGRLDDVVARGAKAVVLVTYGPTGEAIALNAPADAPLAPCPVVVLAPKTAEPFLAAADRGKAAKLVVSGQGGRRPTFNLIARLERGASMDIVLSTPRSGWFGCAGERGPGVAVWLVLARWAAKANLAANVELVCTSGHEYENSGGAHYLESKAPAPGRVRLWLHLGANLAARDWHDLTATWSPLPSADPQRYLMASPELAPALTRLFAGQPGLEAVYPASVAGSAGELTHILRAGYAPALGIFGAHRFHHVESDDLRCVNAALARRVAEALRTLLRERLAA